MCAPEPVPAEHVCTVQSRDGRADGGARALAPPVHTCSPSGRSIVLITKSTSGTSKCSSKYSNA
eukprot:248819-Chlamydomonas_euryale.AAC.1